MLTECCAHSDRGITRDVLELGVMDGVLKDGTPLACMVCGTLYRYSNGTLIRIARIPPAATAIVNRLADLIESSVKAVVMPLALVDGDEPEPEPAPVPGTVPDPITFADLDTLDCFFCNGYLMTGATVAEREGFIERANAELARHNAPGHECGLTKQLYLQRIRDDQTGMRICKGCSRIQRKMRAHARSN